jgi:hypothetical protein
LLQTITPRRHVRIGDHERHQTSTFEALPSALTLPAERRFSINEFEKSLFYA